MRSISCESLSNLLPLTHWKQPSLRTEALADCCESLSNLLPLTHWKQRKHPRLSCTSRCESLSNLLPLTHWKQPPGKHGGMGRRCESLSNLLPLTHWKQPAATRIATKICCESLSNLLPLTHWKQHDMRNPMCIIWLYECFRNKKIRHLCRIFCLYLVKKYLNVVLEQFKLDVTCWRFFLFLFGKKFHISELFVSNGQYSDFS